LKIKSLKGVSGKLLEIHRNERCVTASSREWDWEQIHEKNASKTGCWYVELEEAGILKSEELWQEHTDIKNSAFFPAHLLRLF